MTGSFHQPEEYTGQENSRLWLFAFDDVEAGVWAQDLGDYD